METRISVLKGSFGEIVDLKEMNISILHTLKTRIQQIKSMYDHFIQTNREQLFVFTLDSFHFQGKLIDIELEDMNRMFLFIINRMYCDYYKLFKIIVAYSYENIPDKKLEEIIKINDNYPIYKDLEPFKQYDFQHIQSIHEIILVILTYLHNYITNKEHDLKVYESKNQIGLNIDSFVNTFSFNTVVMNQRALLFVTYMEFFHKSHTKYLKRFSMKLNLMNSQLTNDIKIDTQSHTKTTNKDIINKLKEQNIDHSLLKELKITIMEDTNSDTKSESIDTPHFLGVDRSNNNNNNITQETHQQESISDLSEGIERIDPVFTKLSIRPFRIEDAESNRSDPFISAPEGGILNEDGCKNEPNDILLDTSVVNNRPIDDCRSQTPSPIYENPPIPEEIGHTEYKESESENKDVHLVEPDD